MKVISGAGNTFVVADDRTENFPSKNQEFIASLCLQNNTDGLILLQNSSTTNFRMRIFNNDGKEAVMCGNGLRCLIKFMSSINIHLDKYLIDVSGKTYSAYYNNKNITVEMPDIDKLPEKLSINTSKGSFDLYSINTGVPHVVFFTKNLQSIDVKNIGREIRHHKNFQPDGTNVNFAHFDKKLSVRTFERGIEDETLACGTGSTATAIACASHYKQKPPFNVYVKSKDILTINFQLMQNKISNITMSGPATIVRSAIQKTLKR